MTPLYPVVVDLVQTQKSRPRSLLALITIVVFAAQSCGATTHTSVSAAPIVATPQPPVILYGDSIGYEISPYLRTKLMLTTKRRLVSRTFGGTNACDFLGLAKEDRVVYQPKYVVIVFVGNFFTSCMGFVGQMPTVSALTDRTIAGIKNLMAHFPKSHFFLLGFARPVTSQAAHDAGAITTTDLLNWKLSQLARATNSTYVTATRVLYDWNGRAQISLPCSRQLDGGLCGPSGRVTVRSPDGVHLCPSTPPAVLGVLPTCAVPSPGALRFSNLVANAINAYIAAHER